MTTEINIRNMSANAHSYEFIVARFCEGDWWFYGAYTNGGKSEQVAIEVYGMVVHNVIAH